MIPAPVVKDTDELDSIECVSSSPQMHTIDVRNTREIHSVPQRRLQRLKASLGSLKSRSGVDAVVPTKERAFKEDGSRALYEIFSTWGLGVRAALVGEGHPQKGVDLSYAPDRYGTNQ